MDHLLTNGTPDTSLIRTMELHFLHESCCISTVDMKHVLRLSQTLSPLICLQNVISLKKVLPKLGKTTETHIPLENQNNS